MAQRSTSRRRPIENSRVHARRGNGLRIYRPLDEKYEDSILAIRNSIINNLPADTTYWMRAPNRYGVTLLSNMLINAQLGARNVNHADLACEMRNGLPGSSRKKITDASVAIKPVWYGGGNTKTLALRLESSRLQEEGEAARTMLCSHLGSSSLEGVDAIFEPHLTIGRFGCDRIPNLGTIIAKAPRTISLDPAIISVKS
jgi:hypothetical protein